MATSLVRWKGNMSLHVKGKNYHAEGHRHPTRRNRVSIGGGFDQLAEDDIEESSARESR
jgi:hypothetical protein